MPVRKPTLAELARIAQTYGLDLADEDVRSFQGLIAGLLPSYDRVDALTEPRPAPKYPRDSGYRPAGEENRHNAWYYKARLRGAASGPLSGKRIAIKDNICVAGVPMMNGSAVLEGYVPDTDATLVTRILDAGGEIAGKAVCESLCFSGASHTADTGPVRNPRKPTHAAGGSSGGSAALVAAAEVDMAIGGDQGGSIRIPSAWCGIYGLKPTYGLVPYTGAFPIELTLDHLGPMAGSTKDVALLLGVIAGKDGLDPRQGEVRVEDYASRLTPDVRGLRLGIVEEGFAWSDLSEPDVDRAVQNAARQFAKLGAEVSPISIPVHRDAVHIWNAIAIEGATMLMVKGNGMGTNWRGQYTTSLSDFFGRSWPARVNDMSETTKLVMLLGHYLQERYQGHYYAKAQNLTRTLRRAYDEALQRVDILLMPTVPLKATPLPPADVDREQYVARALEMIPNTAPFNASGHPAMNVPCSMSGGLPIGMMLIGRHWEEGTVLRAAHAFETATDWKSASPPA